MRPFLLSEIFTLEKLLRAAVAWHYNLFSNSRLAVTTKQRRLSSKTCIKSLIHKPAWPTPIFNALT